MMKTKKKNIFSEWESGHFSKIIIFYNFFLYILFIHFRAPLFLRIQAIREIRKY